MERYKMRVLIACEYSGRVGDAFHDLGHEVTTCDLLPCEGKHPENHYEGDITTSGLLEQTWDLVIAFPSCQYLTNSGVRWVKDNQPRFEKMHEACHFFKRFKSLNTAACAIENPIPHKYARQIIGKYSQIVQPYWFGDPYSKQTCLWLYNLPPLKPTNLVEPIEGSKMHRLPPSPDRAKKRSLTPAGLALAMAEQWGFLKNKEKDKGADR